MKIFELETNNVSKGEKRADEYWDEYWDINNYKKVLPIVIDDYTVRYNGYDCISVWDKKRVVAWIEINATIINGLKFYVIEDAKVRPSYAGKGIGLALYTGLVLYCGISLAGTDHSIGARKTWARISKDKRISCWAININGSAYKVASNSNETELVLADSKKRIYNNSKYDAVILTKKNSQNDKKMINMAKNVKNDKPEKDILGTKWHPDNVRDYL